MKIDELAMSIQKGFEEMAAKITEVTGNIEGLEVKMDERFDRLENRELGTIERRLDLLQDDMRKVKTTLKMK